MLEYICITKISVLVTMHTLFRYISSFLIVCIEVITDFVFLLTIFDNEQLFLHTRLVAQGDSAAF